MSSINATAHCHSNWTTKLKDGRIQQNLKLLADLNDMRKNKFMTDVVLRFGEIEFPAHKLILINASSYFKSKFENWGEKSIVHMGGITEDCGQFLLDFMYTGLLPEEHLLNNLTVLKEIMVSAKDLELEDLFTFCLHHLADTLSKTNIGELFKLSKEYSDSSASILYHIATKFGHLHNRPDFLKLKAEQVKAILKHPSINRAETDEVLAALLTWVEYNDKSRVNDLEDLVTQVELCFLSFNYLITLLYSNHWLKGHCEGENHPLDSKCKFRDLLVEELMLRSKSGIITREVKSNYRCTLYGFQTRSECQTMEKFDINTNQWLQTKQLDFLRKGAAVVAHSGYIYFMGGQISDIQGSKEVLKFCPMTNQVVSTGKLIYPVLKAKAWALNGVIYVLDESYTCHKLYKHRIQCYNPADGTSQPLSPKIKKQHLRRFRKDNLLFTVKHRANYTVLEVTELDEPNSKERVVIPPPQLKNVNAWIKEMFLNNQVEGYDYQNRMEEEIKEWYKFDFIWDECTGHSLSELHRLTQLKKWQAYKYGKPVLLTQDEGSVVHTYDLSRSRWTAFSETNCSLLVFSCAVVSMEPNRPIGFLSRKDLQLRHVDRMLVSLNSARINCILTDAIFRYKDKLVEGHKLVLSTTHCKYLECMFFGGQKESMSGICHMKTGTEKAMNVILQFLYTGYFPEDDLSSDGALTIDLTVNFQHYRDVLESAHMMDIKPLFMICLNRMHAQLNMGNYSQLLQMAKLFSQEGLYEGVQTFLLKNLTEWSNCKEFLHLDVGELKSLLQHPETGLVSVKDIVNALLKWFKHDRANREGELVDLLMLLDAHCTCDTELDEVCEIISNYKLSDHRLPRTMAVWRMIFGRPITKGSKLALIKNQCSGSLLHNVDMETKRCIVNRVFPFKTIEDVDVISYGCDLYLFIDDIINGAKIVRYSAYRNEILQTDLLECDMYITGAAGVNGALYVVGKDMCIDTSSFMVMCYSVVKRECRKVSTQGNLSPQYVFAFNESLYVVGATGGIESLILVKYDPVMDEWYRVTAIPELVGQCVLTFTEGKLFAMQTSVGLEQYTKLCVFDVASGKWAVKNLRRAPSDVRKMLVFQHQGQLHLWVLKTNNQLTDIFIESKQNHQQQYPLTSVHDYVQHEVRDGFEVAVIIF